jgi:hypothetical protein
MVPPCGTIALKCPKIFHSPLAYRSRMRARPVPAPRELCREGAEERIEKSASLSRLSNLAKEQREEGKKRRKEKRTRHPPQTSSSPSHQPRPSPRRSRSPTIPSPDCTTPTSPRRERKSQRAPLARPCLPRRSKGRGERRASPRGSWIEERGRCRAGRRGKWRGTSRRRGR